MKFIRFALAAAVPVAAHPARAQQPSPLVGGWGGALEVSGVRLRLRPGRAG